MVIHNTAAMYHVKCVLWWLVGLSEMQYFSKWAILQLLQNVAPHYTTLVSGQAILE